MKAKVNRFVIEALGRGRKGKVQIRADLGFKFFATRYAVAPKRLPDGPFLGDIVEKRGQFKVFAVGEPEQRTYRYYATVNTIYDGDTITEARVELGLETERLMKFRLSGINTPELRGDSKAEGIIARDRLIELVLGRRIVVQTDKDKTGKYGRYLATLYARNWNVNNLLLEEGLAVPY